MVTAEEVVGEFMKSLGPGAVIPIIEQLSGAQILPGIGEEAKEVIAKNGKEYVSIAGLYALLVRGGDYLSKEVVSFQIPEKKGIHGGRITITLGTLIFMLIIWEAYRAAQ